MKKILGLILALAVLGAVPLARAAEVGKPAPDFTAVDSNGKKHKLSEFKGKFLVLEWHNKDCPFVRSQYMGKMQKLQAKWTAKKVAWCAVISSAPGKEGYVDATEANDDMKTHQGHVTYSFLDPSGTMGQAYGAKTTPHMFVIDPKGKLVYDGAIDNAPLADGEVAKTERGETFVCYVDRVLQEMVAEGRSAPSVPSTPPYGCHVKYK